MIIVSAIDAAHALARRTRKRISHPFIALEQIASLIRRRSAKRTSPRVVADAKVAIGLLKSGK